MSLADIRILSKIGRIKPAGWPLLGNDSINEFLGQYFPTDAAKLQTQILHFTLDISKNMV
ncbi:AVN_HP_G0119980.mRNA.1.CDS.1 [Saccharomyces cerevisiae]|nr:AVN_HP_G0119980.mRNA.1.CDS.1 [Saccharomyces cerevisiae]CAI6997079.1 AVN_HP_G0119980.mRNA.1.CDS.1 [Saccharomyces cerevisiae]